MTLIKNIKSKKNNFYGKTLIIDARKKVNFLQSKINLKKKKMKESIKTKYKKNYKIINIYKN